MASEQTYDQSNGSIFVQPGGPGTPLYYLSCYDAEDVSAPQGGLTLELCRKADGSGQYDVIASAKAPPELVTGSLTGITGKVRDWLQKAACPLNIYYMRHTCGRADNPTNYESALVLRNANIASRTFSGIAHHKEAAISTHSVDLEAFPPLLEVQPVKTARVATTETQAGNDVVTDTVGQCASDCGPLALPGAKTVIVHDSAVAPAFGNVLLSTNGTSFAAAAAQPFAAGKNILAVTRFLVGKSTIRILAAMEAPAAAQGMVAYSDDSGATWTVVNIGGAAAGHGAKNPKALFALSANFIVLVSALGYIYKSTDGGITWTAKESGVITVNAYNGVHFANTRDGWAVSSAGVVAVTHDGGEIWSAATPINAGAAVNNCVWSWSGLDAMVGDAAGKLWKTTDGGVTWTQMTGFTGSGVGAVKGISFVDELVGYMVRNTAAPVGSILRTIDGGYNWTELTAVTNSGYNTVSVVDWNNAWVVGEPNAGTAMIVKVYEE